MNLSRAHSLRLSHLRTVFSSAIGALSSLRWAFVIGPSLFTLLCVSGLAQTEQDVVALPIHVVSNAPELVPSQDQSAVDQNRTGSINGTIVDRSGAPIDGARVKLTQEGQSQNHEVRSGDDGQFSFDHISPGPFQLTVAATDFESQTSTGILRPNEFYIVPKIALAVATAVTEMKVEVSQVEVAEEQIRIEEKQRVLGVIPNFYVSYIPDAAPLTSKQKLELGWKTTVDPFSFGLIGVVAGVEQAQNDFSGYGQGAQGYGKRFGAAYADFAAGTFLGGVILPSLLKQDPRYFYKGTGNWHSRALYALSSSVVCKGDNRRWQANYSNIVGSFAAGGLSNLYYPAEDRHGARLTIENGLIGIGATGAANLIQEFLIPKLTRNVPKHGSAKP